MKSIARLLMAFSFLFVTSAHAKVLLEPYAGYYSSAFEAKVKANGMTQKITANGFAIGARAGYMFDMGMWLAADYLLVPETEASYSDSNNTQVTGYKGSRSILGVDIGFDLPVIPLRFWAGYGFMDDWKTKTSSSETDWKSTTIKAGVGYKVIPLLSINLEYMVHSPSKYKNSSGTETDVSDVYEDVKTSTFMLSLSVPYTL